jgi:hypothetical protein
MKKIIRDSRIIRKSKKHKLVRSTATVKETRVVLFGSASDPEVKASLEKIAATGRGTELAPRPSFDTGLGMCGNHLCSCKTICKKEYTPGAFPGDTGAMMGMCY